MSKKKSVDRDRWSVVDGVLVYKYNCTWRQAWKFAKDNPTISGICVVANTVAERMIERQEVADFAIELGIQIPPDNLSVSEKAQTGDSYGLEYPYVVYKDGEDWFVSDRNGNAIAQYSQREHNFYDKKGKMQFDYAYQMAHEKCRKANNIKGVNIEAIDSTP